MADYKEVFMLFDRDEDGVLSFQELQVVMKSMGQRPSGPVKNTFNELFLRISSQRKNCWRRSEKYPRTISTTL